MKDSDLDVLEKGVKEYFENEFLKLKTVMQPDYLELTKKQKEVRDEPDPVKKEKLNLDLIALKGSYDRKEFKTKYAIINGRKNDEEYARINQNMRLLPKERLPTEILTF